MKKIRGLFDKVKLVLNPGIVYSIAILLFFTSLAFIFFDKVSYPIAIILANLSSIIILIAINYYFEQINPKSKFAIIRKILYLPLLLLCYTQVQFFIRIVNPNDYDWLLIKVDYFIFDINPTQFLNQFQNSYLTEFLVFSYFSFYIIPIFHAVVLEYQNKIDELDEFTSIMPFAFFVSYILYFLLPAIGPRFTLHNFMNYSIELPGIFFSEFMREIINSGGGIPSGVSNPEYYVNRDCFPSGHTMLTLMNIILAYKYNTKFKNLILFLGISLIVSTVYLRYHYVIDVIFGIIFCFIVLWLEPKLRKYIILKLNYKFNK